MSIKTNSNGLPDIKELERLANEFYAVLPGNFPNSSISDQVKKPQAFNVNDPPTSLADPHFAKQPALPSAAINALAPAIAPSENPFTSAQQLPDYTHYTNYADSYNIVQPIPGIGATPAALQQRNAYNPTNTYTPGAIADIGNTKQPFAPGFSPLQITEDVNISPLPYGLNQPFDSELKEIFKSIHTVSPSSQLPDAGFSNASYYFFSEKSALGNIAHASPYSANVTSTPAPVANAPFDVNLIKKDFPILQEYVNGRPLIWLDNAATTQKPKQVIDRISYFYEHENSNIHRAAHELAARATDAYEAARKKVQVFLNAASVDEIVFVRGTTEAINLVAKSWGEQYLQTGDEIILSHLEHHANIVPWQQLAAKKGVKLRVIPVDDDGQIILEEYAKLLNSKTRLVAITQVSNALGTVTPIKQIIEMAHAAGAKVLVDGAQSVSHMRIDVTNLDADWFVFSGHKVFGPTGIGVLYGKLDLLNATQPWQGGGNMIKDVTFEHTEYHNAPGRFEAGTGNIADAVGLGAAIDYVTKIGIDLIYQYEHQLLLYATKLLKDVPGLRLIGTAANKASVFSFVFDGYRTEEVGAALNEQGIAVRSGHHCAQPILRRFGLENTVRPSLAFYNTCSDIDVLVETLYRLRSKHKQALR